MPSAGAAATWAQGVRADLCDALADLAQDHAPARAARRATSICAPPCIKTSGSRCRCLEAEDFYEGVRALLIDRDRKPRWQPERLQDVSEAMVDAYFAALGADELQLASRAEMQGFDR